MEVAFLLMLANCCASEAVNPNTPMIPPIGGEYSSFKLSQIGEKLWHIFIRSSELLNIHSVFALADFFLVLVIFFCFVFSYI